VNIDNVQHYVAGYETNNVVVLSPEGKNCRQILTKSDGLDKPYSLRINIDRSELLVCNENASRNDMFVEFIPEILTRSINLPLGSKYTM
jgi:hypothetical protein